LSCILVLPFYQRKGYGKFLITFSYELSLIEGKVGGPEKPLSDLGKETYLSWWTQRLIDFIRENKGEPFTVGEISRKTCITEEDIKWTLEKLKLIKISNGQPYLCTDERYLAELYKKAGRPGLRVLPEKIHFIPYRVKWDNPTLYI
jgi:GNAT superfamily N-acetyltransferase